MRHARKISLPLASLMMIATSIVAPATHAQTSSTSRFRAVAGASHAYLMYRAENGVGCREATADERAAMRRDSEPLHVITPPRTEKISTGLTITLRATSQLEGFPQAKAAFLRAAAEWEARVATPITIVVDVDFGPKRFGESYDPGIIGSTDAQDLGESNAYDDVRDALIRKAPSADLAALYRAMPTGSLPTDKGGISYIVFGSANLRALGLIDAVADPSGEQRDFGDPPSIGFNSQFDYDFDPSNGVDATKTDFDSVVQHELGHVLGFESNVGYKEIDSSAPDALTVLDMFRFRPGTTSGTFAGAQRILTSGGEQRFWTGSDVALSTGRPDNTGGDGEQASHWKANELTGVYLGIMDPTIGDGEHLAFTANDARAFKTFGYNFTTATPITIASASGSLRGDVLTISGTVTSTAGPVTKADVDILDINNAVISNLPTFNIGVDGTGNFSFDVTGLAALRAAAHSRIVLSDNAGNSSATRVVEFGGGDAGGPTISKLKVVGTKMTLTGTGYAAGAVTLEINGTAVPLGSNGSVKLGGTKIKVSNFSTIGIGNGPNRVRVIVNNLRSNIYLVTLS